MFWNKLKAELCKFANKNRRYIYIFLFMWVLTVFIAAYALYLHYYPPTHYTTVRVLR